ncbi:unnamed protein product, partial [Didymodactylos carnosus]
MEELIGSMRKVNSTLERIAKKNDEFEQFMDDRIKHDEIISKKIVQLTENDNDLKKIGAQHEIKIIHYENLFTKLVMPILDEILKLLLTVNTDKTGGSSNAEFKVTINRMRAQL